MTTYKIEPEVASILRQMAREAGLSVREQRGTAWMQDVLCDAIGSGPAWAQEPEDVAAGLREGNVATIITVRARFGLGPFC